MLFQVGGQGSRPTFFEMAAAQQLPSSLRAALTYSFGVLALRRPFFHKVLDYDDEFFAILMLILETHSLRGTDASFSESLYGLRRKPAIVKPAHESRHKDLSSDKLHQSGLRRRQKVLSVVFMVLLPYLKSKLQSIHNKEREAVLHASLWEDSGTSDEDRQNMSQAQSVPFDTETSGMTYIRKKIYSIIGASYPWIHATNEGISFAYQLLYLLDATRFYTPGLHVLGAHVCRATGQELMESSSRIARIRSREHERLRGPPWLKRLQSALLTCAYATLDYAQTGLIAAVLFFKMMEWWYQSAEERMSAPTVYPPPPPPPPPKIAKEGIPLPTDRTMCPLCSHKRVNPSVVTSSGFVFCFPCIAKYVSQYKRCPITLMPATMEQIRKLYHDV